jgi:DNA-binding XRE family transcriptional regulator
VSKNFLDELIEESVPRDPEFPRLLAEARERRAKLRALAQLRIGNGLTQSQVAARMRTSQAVVARIESGDVDTKLSTLERYARAVDASFIWTITSRKADNPEEAVTA